MIPHVLSLTMTFQVVTNLWGSVAHHVNKWLMKTISA